MASVVIIKLADYCFVSFFSYARQALQVIALAMHKKLNAAEMKKGHKRS